MMRKSFVSKQRVITLDNSYQMNLIRFELFLRLIVLCSIELESDNRKTTQCRYPFFPNIRHVTNRVLLYLIA